MPADLAQSVDMLSRWCAKDASPADDFAELAVNSGIEAAVLRRAGMSRMIARQMLADDLSRARQRTLRLVDFDDDELGRRYDR